MGRFLAGMVIGGLGLFLYQHARQRFHHEAVGEKQWCAGH